MTFSQEVRDQDKISRNRKAVKQKEYYNPIPKRLMTQYIIMGS